MNYYHLLVSAALSFVLLKYMFPKIICILCEIILILVKIIDYSENQKEDFTNGILTRLLYIFVFLFAWGVMFALFVPMQVLMFIEMFSDFTNAEMLKSMD